MPSHSPAPSGPRGNASRAASGTARIQWPTKNIHADDRVVKPAQRTRGNDLKIVENQEQRTDGAQQRDDAQRLFVVWIVDIEKNGSKPFRHHQQGCSKDDRNGNAQRNSNASA